MEPLDEKIYIGYRSFKEEFSSYFKFSQNPGYDFLNFYEINKYKVGGHWIFY